MNLEGRRCRPFFRIGLRSPANRLSALVRRACTTTPRSRPTTTPEKTDGRRRFLLRAPSRQPGRPAVASYGCMVKSARCLPIRAIPASKSAIRMKAGKLSGRLRLAAVRTKSRASTAPCKKRYARSRAPRLRLAPRLNIRSKCSSGNITTPRCDFAGS